MRTLPTIVLLTACSPVPPIDVPADDIGLCGDYAAWDQPNWTWSWSFSDRNPLATQGAVSTWTLETAGTERRAGEDALHVFVEGAYADPETQTAYTRDLYYQCDEQGVRYLGQDYVYITNGRQGTILANFPDKPLVTPATLQPGDSWTVDSEGTALFDGTELPTRLGPDQYVVGDPVQIELPAGPFTALPVDRIDEDGGTSRGYLVTQIGWVWWEADSWLTAWSEQEVDQ